MARAASYLPLATRRNESLIGAMRNCRTQRALCRGSHGKKKRYPMFWGAAYPRMLDCIVKPLARPYRPLSGEGFGNHGMRCVRIRAHDWVRIQIAGPCSRQRCTGPLRWGRSQTANSRWVSMMVLQKSAQPVATSNWLVLACFADPTKQQQVVLILVISLCMIVRQIAVYCPPQRASAKGNDL
jgi:hypothetical protein